MSANQEKQRRLARLLDIFKSQISCDSLDEAHEILLKIALDDSRPLVPWILASACGAASESFHHCVPPESNKVDALFHPFRRVPELIDFIEETSEILPVALLEEFVVDHLASLSH